MYGIIATYTDSAMASYAEYGPVTKEILMECDSDEIYDLKLTKSRVERLRRQRN